MFNQAAIRLQFDFDPQKLLADLNSVRSEEWIGHYRNDEYEGDWAIAPLRSVAGHPAIIHAVPGARCDGFFKNTPLLERCPHFKSAIERFECAIGAARLMRLGPGAKILEHSDDMGDGATQELRIHIPVQTNPDVQFWVNRQQIPMSAGETWYAEVGTLDGSVYGASNLVWFAEFDLSDGIFGTPFTLTSTASVPDGFVPKILTITGEIPI